jgi:hypothetical protein
MKQHNDQISSLLNTHRDLDEETLDKMWKQATFVFDSNVLLDLYRLPQNAKNELLGILQSPEIKERIWIGFQGLLEFLNNRHDTISDQKGKFVTVRSKLEQAIASYTNTFKTLNSELAKLKLNTKHSLIDPKKFISQENIDAGIGFVHDFLENLDQLEKQQRDVHEKDDTKKHVIDLFKGKIGQGFNKEQIIEFYKDGENRYKNDIPPGYKDKSKPHSYTVLDIEYKCKFGDLLFWHEIIDKTHTEKLEYVILVTGDLKEDWWLEKRGKKLGPRKELLNEIHTKAPTLKAFHMYDTSNFLRRVGEIFKFNVSESTISETENLLASDRNKTEQDGLVNIPETLEMITSEIENLAVAYTDRFTNFPLVKTNKMIIFNALHEIIDNVMVHSITKAVYIDSRIESHYRTIRFANSAPENKTISLASWGDSHKDTARERGLGLELVRRTLATEGIHVETSNDGNVFMVELFIPVTKLQ